MPTDVCNDTKYVKGISTYILCITGILINRQKAIVNITGIKPFFDVVVPRVPHRSDRIGFNSNPIQSDF